MNIGIRDVAGYVPSNIIDNDVIAHWSGVDEQWIVDRTGIHERRYAPASENTSALAAGAVKPLLDRTECPVDALILATSTPDQPQPATAAMVQELVGFGRPVPAFDVNAVCSGFLYALDLGRSLLATHHDWTAVVVAGADKYSSIMNASDPRTVSLFGDGASAVLLTRVPDDHGIMGVSLITDGHASELVKVPGGGCRQPADGSKGSPETRFEMDGRAVMEWSLANLPQVVESALAEAALNPEDIDRVFLHQGNAIMVRRLAEALGVDRSHVALTAPRFGNTASASIPLTMSADRQRRGFAPSEKFLLASVGGGMTAGAAVVTW
ncbi:3-oxoacyl-[acyl-carrier-protein] synthase-3 [Actinopolyspora biskrensis]|uniref:3-oxoacyl-[acyl-carrier-protein] synthase-3 n=1 Tax=Actinopolyspora biskrensis TaxID=1470178 RepID=A0A852YTN9_9ACTN|nr:ketoacyl-ACP synthase III [Actinopolyspora biskrensis]NYH77460.1 3-oxoacyl-[acyl-carrier-protein] synthase-3 [Actinopolyspora biskrensis]